MKKSLLTLLILLLITSLIGCGPDNDVESRENDNLNLIEVNVKDKELLNRSEDISDWVVELYGIDDVTAIVFNNEAYIALVMAFDQPYTEELENTIEFHVKEHDSLIENVYVTNDTRTFKQISDIVFNLLQGKSYDSQVKEINKTIKRF